MKAKPCHLLGIILGIILLSHASVLAQSGTWTSTSDGYWTNVNNWAGGIVANGAGSTAAFVANLPADRVITIGASPRTIGHLAMTNFNASSRQWTMSSSIGTQWLKYDADGFGGGTSVVAVATKTTLNTSFFDGTNVIRKTGAGTFKLSGANAGHFTGGILVEEGTLLINQSDALNGVGWVNLGGGSLPVSLTADNISTINHCGIRLYANTTNKVTLYFGIANSIEFKNSLRFERQLVVNSANSISDIRLTALLYGYGGIYKTGPGSLRLASYNNQTGPIVISQGRVLLQQHNGAMSGGTVVLGDENTGANAVGVSFGYGISLGADRKFHFTTNGTGSASIGTIAGSTSASTVAGTVQADRDITIGNSTLTGTGLTLSGIISGVGAVRVANSTGYTTRFAGANTYEGGTTVAWGTLIVTSSGKLGSGDVSVSAGATLDLDNGTAISDEANVSLDVGTSTYGVVDLTSGVTETVGTLTINGVSQYAGTYGATGSGAEFIADNHFVGSGKLLVLDGKPRPTLISVR